MEAILGKEIGVPCPVCNAPLVSPTGSHKIMCPQCKIEFTDSQLRDYWDFL